MRLICLTSAMTRAALAATLCFLPALVSAQTAPSGATVWDTFTGAEDTPLTSHTPDVAPASAGWLHWEGSLERIRSNRLTMAPTGGYTVAAIESGLSDGSVSVDVTSGAGRALGRRDLPRSR